MRPVPSTPTIRPMAAPPSGARVHVVEPHGFNDAQEVGDRLKADQPVIINLQLAQSFAAARTDFLVREICRLFKREGHIFQSR